MYAFLFPTSQREGFLVKYGSDVYVTPTASLNSSDKVTVYITQNVTFN